MWTTPASPTGRRAPSQTSARPLGSPGAFLEARPVPDLGDGSFSVSRKFLIFQLNLKDAALRSFGGVDPFSGEAKPGLSGAFKFIDPLDWEDPAAPEYWRNIL